MPRLEEKSYTYFTTVRGMCPPLPVGRARPGCSSRTAGVWQPVRSAPAARTSPRSSRPTWTGISPGPQGDARSFAASRSPIRRVSAARTIAAPARWHASPCHSQVISVTKRLQPPLPDLLHLQPDDRLYHMPDRRDAADGGLHPPGSRAGRSGAITGGSRPSPEILEIPASANAGDRHRVTMNSNGIRLVDDTPFAATGRTRRVRDPFAQHIQSHLSRRCARSDLTESSSRRSRT